MDTYQLGVGAVEITPRIGVPLVGGVAPYPSDGIATRLWVKAMAITQDVRTLLLVTLDNLKYPPSEEAVTMLASVTGLEERNIWITASHAHSCPYYTDYGAELTEAMCQAAVQAMADRTACRLQVCSAQLPGLTGNRRVIKNGQCVNIWLLPKEERARWPQSGWPTAGACDQEVITLAARQEDGRYKALLFNFACHACTSGATPTLISADYPGFARQYLDEALGYPVQTLFWPGACGDINACCDAQTLGRELAECIFQSLAGAQDIQGPVEAMCRYVELPDREVSTFQEDAVSQLWESSLEHFRESFAEAQAFRTSSYRVRLSALRLGQMLMAGVPGELFCELGMDIKAAFPKFRTMVAEQTNGAVGYIPTKKGFGQGGYECLYGEHSVVAEGAGETVSNHMINMLQLLAAEQ